MKLRTPAALRMVSILSIAALAMSGCSSSKPENSETTDGGETAPAEQASTSATTKLVVGFDQDFPPYGYIGDDGQFTGFDLDLAAEVAARNSWEVEYKPINWDAKDLELSSGSIDCIWNGFTIEGREDGYTWTEPYMDNSQVIVVKTDSGIASLAGLAGKTVIVQADSAAFHLLSADGDQEALAQTFNRLQTTPEYNTAFLELESGAVDAIAIDLPVAMFQTQGKEDTYTILDEALSAEHYGVGFLKGNTTLRDEIQQTLKAMVSDGTVKTIAEKYADQGISYDQWILQP